MEKPLPDKLYFKIGEVSMLTGIEPYILRYWESQFSEISPEKTRSGHRMYRKKDVENILKIKQLRYGDGLTIPGAKRRLKGAGDERNEKDDTINKLKRDLQEVEKLLDEIIAYRD